MITDIVLTKIETRLKETYTQAEIVPEDEAYPTSGSTFIRVTGDSTEIVFSTDSVTFDVYFSVICSIRTRDFITQNKKAPYKTLIDLHESVFMKIISDQNLVADMLTLSTRVSLSGRFTSKRLNTRVQKVYPDFFGSTDPGAGVRTQQDYSMREAGYVLNQTYKAPTIHVPFQCLELPSPFAP